MSPSAWPVVVLAGGKPDPELLAQGVAHRALIDLGGERMIDRVMEALRSARSVSQIVVVAAPGFPEDVNGAQVVHTQSTIAGNIRNGLAALAPSEWFTVVTADLPFLTGSGVDTFVTASLETGADITYAAIPRPAAEREFPTLKRTWIPLREGSATGGNILVVRRAAFETVATWMDRAHERRKNPLFLAGLIGPANIVRYVTGQLSLADIERAVQRVVGVSARILRTDAAELGTDLDRISEIPEIRRLIALRAKD